MRNERNTFFNKIYFESLISIVQCLYAHHHTWSRTDRYLTPRLRTERNLPQLRTKRNLPRFRTERNLPRLRTEQNLPPLRTERKLPRLRTERNLLRLRTDHDDHLVDSICFGLWFYPCLCCWQGKEGSHKKEKETHITR